MNFTSCLSISKMAGIWGWYLRGSPSISYLPNKNVIYNWMIMELLHPKNLLEEVLAVKLVSTFLQLLLYLSCKHNICMCATHIVPKTTDYFKTLDQQKLSKEWSNSFSQEPEIFLKCFLNINRNQEVFW